MRSTKVLRYILLVILILFVIYIFKKYQPKQVEPEEKEPEIVLEEGNSQTGRGAEITDRSFRFKAERYVYHQNGTITYHNINLQKEIGDKLITITGDKAEVLYKKDQFRRVVITGNIIANTTDGMEMKCSVLNYFHKQNRISSPQEVNFSKGKIKGRAQRFFYFLNTGIIRLTRDVELEISQEETAETQDEVLEISKEEPIREQSEIGEVSKEELSEELSGEDLTPAPKPPIIIKCGFLEFDQKKHYFILDDNVAVVRDDERLHSQRLTGYLSEDNKYVNQLEAEVNVRSRFGSNGTGHGSQAGNPVGGKPNILKISEGVKNLSCQKLIMHFTSDEKNVPKKIEANGNARLQITLFSSKTARPVEKRIIKGEQLEVELKTAAQRIDRFTAKKRASIEIYEINSSRPEKTMQAREIKGRFKPNTGELRTAEFIGNFKYFQANLKAYANRANYSEKEGSLELRDNPRVLQEGYKVNAEKIYYSLEAEDLWAKDQVVSELPPESLKDMFKVSDAEEPVVFNSDMMIYNHLKNTIHYFGNVKGLYGGNILWADTALIKQNEGELTAEGNVKNLLPQKPSENSEKEPENPNKKQDSDKPKKDMEKLEVFSPYMKYSNKEGKIEYKKGVEMHKGNLNIKAEEIDLYRMKEEDGFERAFARDNVEVIRADMKVNGDTADYNFIEKKMVVKGKKARFIQKGKMDHIGKILTFYLDNDRMILNTDEDSRVKTIYRPKQKGN